MPCRGFLGSLEGGRCDHSVYRFGNERIGFLYPFAFPLLRMFRKGALVP